MVRSLIIWVTWHLLIYPLSIMSTTIDFDESRMLADFRLLFYSSPRADSRTRFFAGK